MSDRNDSTHAALLRSTHLFGDLEEEALQELASACRIITLHEGDRLLRQGDPSDCMYLVIEGRLTATYRDAAGVETLLGEARSGEYVGEGALLADAPRMATVGAVTTATVLELSRQTLDIFLGRNPSLRDALQGTLDYRLRWAETRRLRPDRDTIIQALSESLGGLDPIALAALESEVQWETLPRGALLIRQNDPGECLFFVISGRLRVFIRRDDGSHLDIAEVGPGETIGEMALLSNEPRSASADALRDTELLRLSKKGFDRLIDEQPKTMKIFTRIIVERLNSRIRARSPITQLQTTPTVTVEDCEDVISTRELVLRNLKITQMYHRLSQELALLLGHADANWCTFACNASKTAGYSIRGEGLRSAALAERFSRIQERVTETISAGNLKVFAELAPVFARMVRTFHQDQEHDREKLGRFLSMLRAGATGAGGQDTLAEALTHYYDAMFERSPKRKTELILLGNIKVGLHEQIRLQPNIVEALNAPLVVNFGNAFFQRAASRAGRVLPTFAAGALQRSCDSVTRLLLEWTATVWRRLVTRRLMTLRLPYGALRLGADVPELPNSRMYADMLQTLEHPELIALVKKYCGGMDERNRTRAVDWGVLDERMRFIVNLFRSRQKSLELFDQPFLYEQRQEMAANRVPVGEL